MLGKECSPKMAMTAAALIHFCESANQVIYEIRDCPGISMASVVKIMVLLNAQCVSLEAVILHQHLSID